MTSSHTQPERRGPPSLPPTRLIPSDNTSLTASTLLQTHHVNLPGEGRRLTSDSSTSVAPPPRNAPLFFF